MAFDKVLVANRGEIARRIMRTCRAMGLSTVAVASEADRGAAHVLEADEAFILGPAPSGESYLRADRIIAAARATGAQAIHPGYGFLSENAAFAEAVEAAGLVFVGPTPAAIRAMGSKIAAKRLMAEHGVPVVPGYDGRDGQDDAAFVAAAEAIGFPLLIKASAGGGGKGMRIVRRLDELPAALQAGRREALAAFGDDALLVERYVDNPRHIEVQILGDAFGNVVHLFERECSVQRRHQKILEEAPSPGLSRELRERLGAAAVLAGKTIGYRSAGTVEFVVGGGGGDAHDAGASTQSSGRLDLFFLEVNTRLQVEHPVTELVTGHDLVRLQLEIAMGRPLPFSQDELAMQGHAIEARLYAEDPEQDFLPQTGRLAAFDFPAELVERGGLRLDAGVRAGDEVSIHYDPMLAKVITWGRDRAEANRRLLAALRGAAVHGVTTNLAFLRSVLAHPAWQSGQLSTHFIADHRAALLAVAPTATSLARADRAVRAATVARALRLDEGRAILPDLPLGWRNNRFADPEERWMLGASVITCAHRALGGGRFLTRLERDPGRELTLQVVAREPAAAAPGVVAHTLVLSDGERVFQARVTTRGETTWVHTDGADFELALVPRFESADRKVESGTCQAPMPGKVIAVRVAAGDEVVAQQPLVVLEAMKMEHTLEAPRAGKVAEVLVAPGDVVQGGQDLVILADAAEA